MLDQRRVQGLPIYDLTISNPTQCGLRYPEEAILQSLVSGESLQYRPDPHGLVQAREAVSQYYMRNGITTQPSNTFLAASTSEAYTIVFRLLCDSGDTVLAPKPSYPLLDYIAQLSDIELRPYSLVYDDGWRIDLASVEQAVTSTSRALVIVSPHNPTGMFLKKNEYDELQTIALRHNLALIVDEVFSEYSFQQDARRVWTTVGSARPLVFTLNGISKLAGLPQLKLAWIIVSGETTLAKEALSRLEIITDTFLSVNTPAQVALPELLRLGETIRGEIRRRVEQNHAFLQKQFHDSSCSLLKSEGGWYAILRVPRTHTDEEWALRLLDKEGVCVHPGYFFDFEEEEYLVLSLLPDSEIFHEGVHRMRVLLQ